MKLSRIISILLVLVLVLFCLGVSYSIYYAFSLPGHAEHLFGPAAPGLSLWQRIRLSAGLLWQADSLTFPADPNGSERPFQVALGESTSSITERLWENGLINNPSAFRQYLQYSGLDISLQAGEFKLSPAMIPIEIAKAMQNATSKEVAFRILEGWRLEEIAASLTTSGLNITPVEFLQAAKNHPSGYTFLDQLPPQASLEGFLLPDAYTLPRDLTTEQLIATFLNNFRNQVSGEIRNGFTNQGLALYEGVTLASIVEREALRDDEKPMIASVFLNRLAAEMRLDADPTAQYILENQPERGGWWPVPLLSADLQLDSPYNTYIYPGLPPGPIANPGLSALRAVAFPAQTPYYYFRAVCDGSKQHVFARTYEEHVQNACP